MNPNETTDEAKAAMQEFGFEAVPLDQAGAPAPGRVAQHIGNITAALEEAVAHGDLGAINNAVTELGRLRMALDAWDDWKKGEEGARLLTAQKLLEELRSISPSVEELKSISPSPERAAYQETDDEDQANKRLIRRRACYSEIWWFDQVLVRDAIIDLGVDLARQAARHRHKPGFHITEEVTEIELARYGKYYGQICTPNQVFRPTAREIKLLVDAVAEDRRKELVEALGCPKWTTTWLDRDRKEGRVRE